MANANFTRPGLTPTPGQSRPLASLTATDHSAIILITTAVGLVFALISILIRYFVRLEFRHRFEPDDLLATLSMVFAILQASTVFVAVKDGYGKTLGDVDVVGLVRLQKANYTGDIFYLVTICLTKCSVASLFIRLSPTRSHNVLSYLILGTTTLITIASIFLVTLRCNLSAPWLFIPSGTVQRCSNLFTRWLVIGIFDILIESAIFFTAVFMVTDLQLSLSKKTVVILAFGFRLPVVAPIVVRLHYLARQLDSTDMTFTGVLVQVMTQTEISYAIIAATIPCLRPFVTALSTHYGAPPSLKTWNQNGYRLEFSLNSFTRSQPQPKTTSAASKKTKPISKHSTTTTTTTSSKTTSSRPHHRLHDLSSSQGSILHNHRKNNNNTDNTEHHPHATKDESLDADNNPRTRWDPHEHRATVERGDGHSMESHESRQMIIERNVEYFVQYERRDGGGAVSPSPPPMGGLGIGHGEGYRDEGGEEQESMSSSPDLLREGVVHSAV